MKPGGRVETYQLSQDDDGTDLVAIPYRGSMLLGHNMYYRGTAFSRAERDALGLMGLLPNRERTMEEQASAAYRHIKVGHTPLERYVNLASLEARNAHLYYRVIVDHLEELLPIVYTPTVGEACQHYSRLFRKGRGLWITPDHQGRIRDVLKCAPYDDIRLIVVTDNERILGLGDQGVGGMGIPVGKLDLYVVCAGIHPTKTLPISLDVGTDNEELLNDPAYLGYQSPRLRGPRYDELVEEFVEAVKEVFPRALLQWEDFKKANAFRLLDRYQDRILSFNDDIQGTAGIALAGVVSASRITGTPMERQRVVILGAGAAGIGIARILRAELQRIGVSGEDLISRIALIDSSGLLTDARRHEEAHKRDFAWPAALAHKHGLDADGDNDLLETVKALRPTVLIGTSGQPGTFDERVVSAMAERCERPAIFPFSNPNSRAEAHPRDIVTWTDGKAIIAAGSPFHAVEHGERTIPVSQGNNVYVFPGVGLGALASGATKVVDSFFAVAAHAIGRCVTERRIQEGELYPPLSELRNVSREVGVAVGEHAVELGLAPRQSPAQIRANVDAMMWWPDYPRVRTA
ncbi:MAG: NAD-dependent malic enzyme [Sandaracinaceae bacterium]